MTYKNMGFVSQEHPQVFHGSDYDQADVHNLLFVGINPVRRRAWNQWLKWSPKDPAAVRVIALWREDHNQSLPGSCNQAFQGLTQPVICQQINDLGLHYLSVVRAHVYARTAGRRFRLVVIDDSGKNLACKSFR